MVLTFTAEVEFQGLSNTNCYHLKISPKILVAASIFTKVWYARNVTKKVAPILVIITFFEVSEQLFSINLVKLLTKVPITGFHLLEALLDINQLFEFSLSGKFFVNSL